MAPQPRTAEQRIARLASRAHGIVTHADLLRAGLSADEIRFRRECGLLLAEFRGVYRVGHRAPSVEARYMAAVRACGEMAVLSGPAAAWAWGLLRGSAPPPEVTAPTERVVKGLRTLRRRRMHPADRTSWHGIPITTVPATLVRLASLLPFHALTRAVHEADVRHGSTLMSIEAALERHPNAGGRCTLLAIARGDEPTLLSELERRFLALLGARDLPLPEANRSDGANYVDCRWPARRLTIELDSYRFHRTRHSWEQDRRRERAARARGDDFRRYTWLDVVENPEPTLAEVSRLLGR